MISGTKANNYFRISMSEPSSEQSLEAEKFADINMVAEAVGVPADSVELVSSGSRFKLFFTGDSFVKMSVPEDTKMQLRREVQGTEVANKIGWPSKEVRTLNGESGPTTYLEKENKAIVALELLDTKDWHIFSSPEQEVALEPEEGERIGRLMAEVVMEHSGKEIPEGVETDQLKQGETADTRYRSQESFWKDRWQRHSQMVLDGWERVEQEVGVSREDLERELADAKARIEYLLQQNPDADEAKYFVHSDLAINNIAISKEPRADGRELLTLDYEHAGIANNQFLCRLTDVANFYARAWRNDSLRETFVRQSLRQNTKDGLEDTYHLIRSAIVFGTMHISSFGMQPEHN